MTSVGDVSNRVSVSLLIELSAILFPFNSLFFLGGVGTVVFHFKRFSSILERISRHVCFCFLFFVVFFFSKKTIIFKSVFIGIKMAMVKGTHKREKHRDSKL